MAKTRAKISADWRKNNPDRSKELAAKYYKRDRELLLAKQKKWRKEHPRYWHSHILYGDDRSDAWKISWARTRINVLKTRAKKKGTPFSLTFTNIMDLMVSHCPVTGIELDYSLGNKRKKGAKVPDNSPSIDRIDNSIGYTPSNVILVSNLVNRVKTTLSLEEIQTVLPKLISFYGKYVA